MSFSPKDAPSFDQRDDKADGLRFLERLHKWHGQDWHFKLLEKLSPHEVYGFFGHAKLIERTLWLDGGSKRGIISYDWIDNRFRHDIAAVFGNIRVALAVKGEILKSFSAFFSDKHSNAGKDGYLTKAEMVLMMELSKRAMSGQRVDSYAELAAHRQKHAA